MLAATLKLKETLCPSKKMLATIGKPGHFAKECCTGSKSKIPRPVVSGPSGQVPKPPSVCPHCTATEAVTGLTNADLRLTLRITPYNRLRETPHGGLAPTRPNSGGAFHVPEESRHTTPSLTTSFLSPQIDRTGP